MVVHGRVPTSTMIDTSNGPHDLTPNHYLQPPSSYLEYMSMLLCLWKKRFSFLQNCIFFRFFFYFVKQSHPPPGAQNTKEKIASSALSAAATICISPPPRTKAAQARVTSTMPETIKVSFSSRFPGCSSSLGQEGLQPRPSQSSISNT